MTLKPVDVHLLVWEQQWAPEMTRKEFFGALLRSWRKRWRLRKAPYPLGPGFPSRADRECQRCMDMVEMNTHGDCPNCGYHHLVYIGRTQVLPTIETPRILFWGTHKPDGNAQMASGQQQTS